MRLLEIGVLGEDPAGEDLLAVLPALDLGGRVVRLPGPRFDPAPLAEDEVGHEPGHGDLADVPVVDGRPLPHPQPHGAVEGGVVLLVDADLEDRILPVGAVARLVEVEALVGQRPVDLDRPRQDGGAAVEHRDRALPGLDHPLGIVFRLEAVEADLEARPGNSGRLPFRELKLGPDTREPADDTAGR